MVQTQTLAAGFIWASAGLLGSGLFLYGTPWLESYLAPVLKDQSMTVDASDRTPGRVCWTWRAVKTRYAAPVSLSWAFVIEGTTVEFPAVVERERDGTIVRNPATVATGPAALDFCTNIPQYLDRATGLVIRGQINYRMPHGLWTIWHPLPDVVVPDLPKSS